MVSAAGLTALADMALAPKNQSKLDDLLSRNTDGALTTDETQELDLLLKKIDELNLVKARAAVALHQLKTGE
ncbi:MAG: hypothetical protein ACK5TC_02210 [bacterium]